MIMIVNFDAVVRVVEAASLKSMIVKNMTTKLVIERGQSMWRWNSKRCSPQFRGLEVVELGGHSKLEI